MLTARRTLVSVAAAAFAAASFTPTAVPAPQGCDLFPRARNTVTGTFRVAVVSCPTAIPVNEVTAWTVRVTTRGGKPVRGRVHVTGGMPEHGHGFLTPPAVARTAKPGIYRARLVFAMRGRWVIEFRIAESGRRDVVRYQLIL